MKDTNIRTSKDGQFKYIHKNNTAVLIDYLGDKRILVLPPTVDGIPVATCFPDNSFSTPTKLEAIITSKPICFGKRMFRNTKTFQAIIAVQPRMDMESFIKATDGTFTMIKNLPDDGIMGCDIFVDADTGEMSSNVDVDEFIKAISDDDPDLLVKSVMHLPF